jgi:O-methyltransferase
MTYSKGVEFLEGHPIVSDQVTKLELTVVLAELRKVLAAQVDGDIVELGCYLGTTSLFLQRAVSGKNKTLHVYDSFEGLPPKVYADESPLGQQYKAGELSVGKSVLINNFKHAGLPLPVIHKAWFDALSPDDLPDQICFAYLDGDFYNSIQQSLKLVWPKLALGAVVVVDDYQHQGLPGAKKAVDEWLKTHAANLQVQESLAILRPKA